MSKQPGVPGEIEATLAMVMRLGALMSSPAGRRSDGSYTVAGLIARDQMEALHSELINAAGSTPADAAALLSYIRHFLLAALQRDDAADNLLDAAHLFSALEFTLHRAGVLPAVVANSDEAPWRAN